MHKKIHLFLSLLLISLNCFAGKISGTVADNEKKEPLIGVVVVIKELNKATTTDVDGKFEFAEVPNGTYELVFSMVTYKKLLKTVSVLNSKPVIVDVELKSEGTTLKDVAVKGTRVTNTENAVMLEIRKSNLVVSGISAAQIGKTMDRNAADVVKRVPGVTVQDNRFVQIRGLVDRYNNVWLNDAGAPSTEIDKRAFSFDMIPSGLIDRMLVFKTASPELPGDFAGGMVKIYTSSLPDKNSITLGFSGSYRQGSTGSPFSYEQPSKTDWLGYDDGMRSRPAVAYDSMKRSDSNVVAVSKAFGNKWGFKSKNALPDGRFNLAASGILPIGGVKIGNTLGISYSNTNTVYEYNRQEWDSASLNYYYNDKQSMNNVNVGVLNNTAIVWGNQKIEFKNLYNQLGRSFIVERKNVVDTVNQPNYIDERAYLIGYESRAIYAGQLTGTHKTDNDKTNYVWTLGYSDMFRNMPDLRRIRYTKQPTDDDTLFGLKIGSTVDPINNGGRLYQELYEKTYSFNHQLTQKIDIKRLNYSFEASIGNYLERKERYFHSWSYGYVTRVPKYTYVPIDEIFVDSNINKNRYVLQHDINSYDKYNAKNQMIASFLSLKLPVGNKVNIYGGVRYEHNTQEILSYVNLDTVNPKITTKYWLPSINASYNFNEKSLVRAAYGMTLNRPEFREWSPFYFYDFEWRASNYGALFPNQIAPKGDTLDVAEVQNFDVRWEWYPNPGEMIHAGVFYKSFKNPIQNVILPTSGSDNRAFSFTNVEEAYSMGVEIDARKSFDFIDKWFNTKIFKDFSFVGNAAFVKSELRSTDTATKLLPKTALQGQAPYMFNLGLFYQNDVWGTQGSLLYNVVGPRIYLLGTQDFENIGEMPFKSLDLVLSKAFFKHYSVNIGVQNTLDSRWRLVQDNNLDQKFELKKGDKEVVGYNPGRYFTLGVKVKF